MNLLPSTPKTEFNHQIFIKEYDYDHYLDRYYIYWDLNTVCNFKCSYCYARHEYGKAWNRTDTIQRQILVLKALSLIKDPIFLGFHGGEPTLHKDFLYLIDKSLEILTHQDSRLYIVTNGSTDVFEKIRFNPKIYVLFSIHLEFKHLYGNNFEKVINNIKLMDQKGFKVKVNILLMNDKKYWNDIHFLFNTLKSLNINIHPHFIYSLNKNQEIIYNYTDEFYQEFSELNDVKYHYVFENEKEHVLLSDYELFKYNLNHFKGWKCYNNNFEIKYNGILHQICSDEYIDLCKNPLYFKKYRLKPMICRFDNCMSDGVLKCLKVKS